MCGTSANGKCFSLNAMHGHDVHVVCFQQNQRDEVRNMGEVAGAIMAESGMHNTNYIVYPGRRFYMLEHHPMDSRTKIDDSGTCQTLPARMGTGGGNVPLVMMLDGERGHDYGETDKQTQQQQCEMSESIGSAEQTAVSD